MSAPSTLPVRKLEVDLSTGFERHWHGGDAFRSMFFNALSMSFPVGEQFFIDSVREALKGLPEEPRHAALRETIRGFIGQEATHRRVHGLYNEQLERQGLINRWQHWAQRRIERARHLKPLHPLAVTCAYEHCTAVLADLTLRHDALLAGAEPRMQTLWRWHAAEETEHGAVAFDLYQALSGNLTWRRRWFTYVLILFSLDCLGQTLLNLKHDGSLWRLSTWRSARRFMLGRNGVLRLSGPALLRYYRADFHPALQADSPPARGEHAGVSVQQLAERWLKANADRYRVLR